MTHLFPIALLSPVVTTDSRAICEMEHGLYVVRQRDLPAFQLFQRSAHFDDLGFRALGAGELNGAIGFHASRPSPAPCR